MDDQVRTELCDLLATSGPSLCGTPRVLTLLMRERCPEAYEQVHELELALECGCVQTLLTAIGPFEQQVLVDELMAASGVSAERARWVIATWDLAMNNNPVASGRPLTTDWSTWNQLDVSGETMGGTGTCQRAVWHLGIVGLAGAAGGTVLGFVLLVRGEQAFGVAWREALEGLTPGVQVAALLVLGLLGGLAGGLLGWMFGGGQSSTYDALRGTTLGRLLLSSLGACHGAGIGVMSSLGLFGLAGVMPGALIGAGLGAFLGLFAAERVARFWV
jgi:hypothetical protein